MANHLIRLSVAKEFSTTPGSRFRQDGDFSAEEFYEELLRPAFQRAVDEGAKLEVTLDGVAGYATSFLQGSFGNLAAEFSPAVVRELLVVICEDDPYILKYVWRYVDEAHAVPAPS